MQNKHGRTTKSTRTKVENDWLGCLLKSPIFVKQKAVVSKNWVGFCQKSIGVIRCTLATSYDDVRRCLRFSSSDRQTNRQTNKTTYRGGAHLKIGKNLSFYQRLACISLNFSNLGENVA